MTSPARSGDANRADPPVSVNALGHVLAIPGCGRPPGDEIDNEGSARLAYLGLDRGVDRALKLGFDGYNAASNANIPEQSEPGDLSGMMVVGGQVDAGVSNNKEMRLLVTLEGDYADGAVEDLDVAYNGGPANLDLSMQGLPDATLAGTLSGSFVMSGGLAGNIALDLQITGTTEEAPDGTIRCNAGTIRVVGTATSDYGVFDVDVSL
jgi:hypothetical protein